MSCRCGCSSEKQLARENEKLRADLERLREVVNEVYRQQGGVMPLKLREALEE